MLDGLPDIIHKRSSYSNELFQALWLKGKLAYSSDAITDEIDSSNAQLIYETVQRNERLLLSFPDLSPHRPAMLFATTLLYNLPSYRQKNISNTSTNCILYFGNSIGIREQLSKVKIKNSSINLMDVFRQVDMTRRGSVQKTVDEEKKNELPQVITIYAPARPDNLIKKYNPICVAIDLDDSPDVRWFKSLLEAAINYPIPIVAWSQNPLSECFDNFKEIGNIAIWSPSVLETSANAASENQTFIQPLILDNEDSMDISETLQNAAHLLLPISRQALGQLGGDAIRQHWQLVRAIESLSVPFEFYESEAGSFFGLKSFSRSL